MEVDGAFAMVGNMDAVQLEPFCQFVMGYYHNPVSRNILSEQGRFVCIVKDTYWIRVSSKRAFMYKYTIQGKGLSMKTNEVVLPNIVELVKDHA